MVQSIGWFSHWYFAGSFFGEFVEAIVQKILAETNWRKREQNSHHEGDVQESYWRVNFPGKAVKCKLCKHWFHAKCQGITDTDLKKRCRKLIWSGLIVRIKLQQYSRGDTGNKIFQEVYGWHSVHCQGGTLQNTLSMPDHFTKTYNSLLRHSTVINGNGDLAFLNLNININVEKNYPSLVSKSSWNRFNPEFS